VETQVQAAQRPQQQSVSRLFLPVITWIDCCVDYVLTVRLSGVPVVLRSVHHVVFGRILHMFHCICNFRVLNELATLSRLEPRSSQDRGLFVADFAQDRLKTENDHN